MVSSADAYYAYDPTSAPISPQGGYFHYSIQLLSKLADQSCAELGTPDVQLPSDIFNCSVTHEPSWVSPRAPVYSNTHPRPDDLITRAHLRQVEYCHALTLPLAQMIHITWALLLTESEFSCVPPVPQLSLLLKSLSLLANVASQGSLGCC